VGVLLGGALGAILSSQVVPRLAQNAAGQAITPPFIVQAETAALLQYGIVITVALILVLLASLVVIGRMSISQSLRFGEE
jgi:hypothetical protein